jgi:hypothetical protein
VVPRHVRNLIGVHAVVAKHVRPFVTTPECEVQENRAVPAHFGSSRRNTKLVSGLAQGSLELCIDSNVRERCLIGDCQIVKADVSEAHRGEIISPGVTAPYALAVGRREVLKGF